MLKPSTSSAFAYERVRAPRGTTLSCKGWQQEAALRMLMNSFDPDVAEKPEELIVSRRSGKVAHDWESFQAIIAALKTLESDETLLVQLGKPAGILHTDAAAPRVLIANSKPAAREGTRKDFDETEPARLAIPSATVGSSWTYVGTQTALPAAYETFSIIARKHFHENLAGKLVVSSGMGGLGGAQPVAATLNGAAFLGIDVDPERVKRRVKSGYCDVMVNNLDEALRILKNAVRKREATSVGLVGNCADLIPALARRGVVPDVLTDQTSADDPVGGYIPRGLSPMQAAELRASDPGEYRNRSLASIKAHAEGMVALQKLGALVFDGGSKIGLVARDQYTEPTSDIPDFEPFHKITGVPAGRGILRWIALSGEPSDIHRLDQLALEMLPLDESLVRWIGIAGKRVRFQGLPARVCWMDYGEQAQFGVAVNDLVSRGDLKAPFVIARDFSDSSVASAVALIEKMHGGSGALVDSRLLSGPIASANGASWAAFDIEGRAEESRSQRATRVLVADGSKEMSTRIHRVLSRDASTAPDGLPET